MDESRSTTPPHPPPHSPATPQLEEFPPPSAQKEAQEVQQDPAGLKESASQSQSQSQVPKMDPNHHSKLPRLANSKTPEPLRIAQINHQQTNGHGHGGGLAQAAHLVPERSSTPTTPGGSLSPFDWDDLETRFEKALADANHHEEGLMAEFESLVKYFNIWATTASVHDNERASKRLQTRTQFVKLREADLAAKKKNYEQVVSAFQSAMVLLHQAQT